MPAVRDSAAAWKAIALGRLLQVKLPRRVHHLVARVLRRSSPALALISDDELFELASSSRPEQRALVLGRLPRTSLSLRNALDAATSQNLVGPAALLFKRLPALPGERSAALHEAIVLDSASSPSRSQCALVCVRHHVEEITSAHARAIVRRCLNLAEQPLDPYAPSPLAMNARTAAAALLGEETELDAEILQRLRDSQRSRELALIQAAALQARRRDFGSGVAAALEALQPQRRQALGFARDCDRNYSALDSAAPRPARLERAADRMRRLAGRVTRASAITAQGIAILLLPALGVLAALGFDARIVDLPDDVAVGSGSALAALGLLVAVHVLSAELAADRLAGPIARVTSFPLPLKAGYMAGLALLAASFAAPSEAAQATYSAAIVGLIGSLVVLVLWALLTLLRRTDPVRAVDAFVNKRAPAVRRAGRRLGRLQARALAQRELVSGYPFVKTVLSTPLGERRAQMEAHRSGYVLLDPRRFRRLADRQLWAQERARLVIVSPLGLKVSGGDEIISIVPTDDTSLSNRDIRRVRRLLRIRDARPIDEASEYVSVLLGVAAAQSSAGNSGGAIRIRDGAVRLVEAHLNGIRERRDRHGEHPELVGMVAMLGTCAVQALRLLNTHSDANTREVLTGFLQRVLVLTDGRDGFAFQLASQIGLNDHGLKKSLVRQLLWDCAAQALRVNDDLGVQEVYDQIARHFDADDAGVELGGRIVQLAAVTRPGRADHLWKRHSDRTGEMPLFPLTAARIGASALRVGNASLALTVALALRGTDSDAWREYFEDRATIDRETATDGLSGGLLGPDAQFALLEFVEFHRRVVSAVGE